MYRKKDKVLKIAVLAVLVFGTVGQVLHTNKALTADSTSSSNARKSELPAGEQPVIKTTANASVATASTVVETNRTDAGFEGTPLSKIDKKEYASDRVIVKYKENATTASKLSATWTKQVKDVSPLTGIGAEMLQLNKGSDISKVIDELKKDPNVAYAEPDYAIHPISVSENDISKAVGEVTRGKYPNVPDPVTPNDPFYPEQWGLNNTGQTLHQGDAPAGTPDIDIDAPEAWGITQGSKDLIVAVIGSGVQTDLPDLKANIWKNPNVDPNMDDLNGWEFVAQ